VFQTIRLRKFFISACLGVVLIIHSGSVRCETFFKLADLSNEQRDTLFEQIDRYGLLTAMLNFCQRPPKLVERLTHIVNGCVEKASITVVVSRYNAAIAAENGRWDCSDKGLVTMIQKYEAKIDSVVSGMKTACRFRSFYNISFPKINLP
jgi:hypothetical protein